MLKTATLAFVLYVVYRVVLAALTLIDTANACGVFEACGM